MYIFTSDLALILCCLFNAILFLQSGLDKVFNYKGNLEYFKDHFSKSPLAGTVGILTPVITLTETAAGACCAIGAVMLLINGDYMFSQYGMLLSGLSILMLFFGQRMANDYAGAATLVPYFLVSVSGVFLSTLSL